ncbi:MAG TPA: 3-isopropylmalate dehydratase small subunit [Candidatus Baltobacteraceae bacterium]|jgi:3-isopropylmalate/(R)-2-methylmalate dehydratase small subunit
MEKFKHISGVAVPMLRDNIDTDAIIPVPFLKDPNTDFGAHLFHNLRYDVDGREIPAFILNRREYRRAQIVVAQKNFGCGSSREHAVWALMGFGIRCVIAESFGDIFYNSSLRMGLLPVILPGSAISAVGDAVERSAGRNPMHVDLEAQRITTPDGVEFHFEIEPMRRRMLLEGLDAVGVTLLQADKIEAFEKQARARRPWMYDVGFENGTPV